jgi:multidrug efflux pump subunit AcrB
MDPPDGYTIAPDDHFKAESGIERRALLPAGVAGMVLVFMVFASVYESFVTPLVVMLSVPCSFIGLTGVLLVTRLPWGAWGGASMVLVLGIVVSNAVALVDVLYRRCRWGGLSAVAHAASERVRPVIMTMVVTSVASVPMVAFSRPEGFWYGFALVSIGGILTSSVLCLAVIPPFFVLVHRISTRAGGSQTWREEIT